VTDTVGATDPSSVDEPDFGAVLGAHLGQLLCVDVGVEGEEGFAEAGGESGDGLGDAHLSACYFRRVSTDKMVHGLLGFQLGHGRHHSECITSQKDDVFRVATNRRDLNVFNVL